MNYFELIYIDKTLVTFVILEFIGIERNKYITYKKHCQYYEGWAGSRVGKPGILLPRNKPDQRCFAIFIIKNKISEL